MRTNAVPIMLVDDHTLIRQCCRQSFEAAGFKVVAEAGSGEEAVQQYIRTRPRAVVMDLSMKNIGGLEAIKRIRTRDPQARILVLSMHDEPAIAARAIRAGACGYVTKTSDADTLIDAVRRVSAGETYLSPELALPLALIDGIDADNPLRSLSPREFEVLCHLVDGDTVAEIAEALSLSHKTVGNCLIRIRQKLGAKGLVDLIKLALSFGINKQNILTS